MDHRTTEELKYAHLGHRDTPERRDNRQALQEHIAEIQAEVAPVTLTGPVLALAPRYQSGRPRNL